MPKVLTKIRLEEGSHVDRGANQHANVVLVKRDGTEVPFKGAGKPFGSKDDGDADEKKKKVKKLGAKGSAPKGTTVLDGNDDALGGLKDGDGDGYDGDDDCDVAKCAGWEPYWKREFTTEQRRAMAHNGQAMPGGGYPIGSRKDVKNAVRAIGRAKKPGKTKTHIIGRANALGATDLIPDHWTAKSIAKLCKSIVRTMKSEGGEDFSTELAEMRSTAIGEGLMGAVHDACHAMKRSIESIVDAGGVPDRGPAIRDSFSQFVDHVAGLSPTGDVAKVWKERAMAKVGKSFREVKKAFTSVGQNDDEDRDAEIKRRGKTVDIESEGDGAAQVDQKDNKPGGATAKAADKVWKQAFKSLYEMDGTHLGYLRHADNLMDAGEVRDFVLMGKKDRDAWIEANPLGKMTEKRMADLPEPLRKKLEDGAAAADRLAKREEAELVTTLAKRAGDAGLRGEGDELVAAMKALHKADSASFESVMKAVETLVKAVQSQERTATIFKEFGKSGSAAGDATGSAHEQLMRKAEAHVAELEKVGKRITVEQAYSELIEKRENHELLAMAKREGSVAA